jgi:adenylylsulfate kinase-like enzyme
MAVEGETMVSSAGMSPPGEKPVLILTGAPGSGKSTVARLLAAKSERAVHLESDLFFHFIQSGRIEPGAT